MLFNGQGEDWKGGRDGMREGEREERGREEGKK